MVHVEVSGPSLFVFKQKTAYEIPKRDWSSDVCSSDLVKVNTTGTVLTDNGTTAGVPRRLTAGDEAVVFDFRPSGTSNVTLVEGTHLKLAIAGFVDVSGDFSFSKTISPANPGVNDVVTTEITIGATNVNSFFGVGGDTASLDDDTGVRLSDGKQGLLISETVDPAVTTAPTHKYALVARGTVALVGVTGLTLSGTVSARVNATGTPVTDDGLTTGTPRKITVGGEDIILDFTATGNSDVKRFEGSSLRLAVAGFVDLTGNYSFSKTSTPTSPGPNDIVNTELAVAATNVHAFLGAGAATTSTTDDVGIKIDNASLGLLIFNTINPALTTQTPSRYALVANGSASLVGVTGLTLSGDNLSVTVNRTGTNVTDTSGNPRTLTAGNQTITLDFRTSGVADLTAFEGTNLTLGISGFVSLKGNFSFSKTETRNAQVVDVFPDVVQIMDTFTNAFQVVDTFEDAAKVVDRFDNPTAGATSLVLSKVVRTGANPSISLNGAPLTSGFSLGTDRRTLTFTSALSSTDHVAVTYASSTLVVQLTKTPKNGSITSVTIKHTDGTTTAMTSSNYTLNTSNNQLTIDSTVTLSDSDDILVTYTNASNVLSLRESPKNGQVVSVVVTSENNNTTTLTSGYTIDATAKTITFTTPLAPTDDVAITYQPATVTLRLTASPLNGTLGSVVVQRNAGGTTTLTSSDYTFNASTRTITINGSVADSLAGQDDIAVTYLNAATSSTGGGVNDIVHTTIAVAGTGGNRFLG